MLLGAQSIRNSTLLAKLLAGLLEDIGPSGRASEGADPFSSPFKDLGHAFQKGKAFPASGPFSPAGRGKRAKKATCYFTDGSWSSLPFLVYTTSLMVGASNNGWEITLKP